MKSIVLSKFLILVQHRIKRNILKNQIKSIVILHKFSLILIINLSILFNYLDLISTMICITMNHNQMILRLLSSYKKGKSYLVERILLLRSILIIKQNILSHRIHMSKNGFNQLRKI